LKKSIAVLVLLALMLTGCRQGGGESTNPGTQVPTQAPTVAPTAAPTERPTEPTIPPTEPIPDSYGAPVIYGEWEGDPALQKVNVSGCVKGYLYYLDFKNDRLFTVLEEEVLLKAGNDNYVFYVKASEPNRIYMTPKANFQQHTLLYESTSGAITLVHDACLLQYDNELLCLTTDNKKMLLFNITTGETELVAEQYNVQKWSVIDNSQKVDSWRAYYDIYFVGKLSEDDELDEYCYYRDTGIVEEWPYL